MVRISLEANIGAGKTTFLKTFPKYWTGSKPITTIPEPLQKWQSIQDTHGDNLLDHFYQDPSRWSYTFQSATFITRIQNIQENLRPGHVHLMERSIQTDRHCFAALARQNGCMNEMEWKLYLEWFGWLEENFQKDIEPDFYLYLRASPETCYQRMRQRDRSEETNVSLTYLQELHDKHEMWLRHQKIPVIVLDADDDFAHNPHKMAKWSTLINQEITTFLTKEKKEFFLE